MLNLDTTLLLQAIACNPCEALLRVPVFRNRLKSCSEWTVQTYISQPWQNIAAFEQNLNHQQDKWCVSEDEVPTDSSFSVRLS
ncbi:hypothetical protein B0J14DRAFT_100856 [Halenospora varia]|nr:hypothetical protein B0J14DRAFT_100856 [Halenospora varia]